MVVNMSSYGEHEAIPVILVLTGHAWFSAAAGLTSVVACTTRWMAALRRTYWYTG